MDLGKSMEIKLDDLKDARVLELINEHLQGVRKISPPSSVHALGLETLRESDITFWSIWEGEELMGCGALKELDVSHGEIKSMRTSSKHLRKGVASLVLQHIVGVAKKREYLRISLETGSQTEFEPARNLYRKFGFNYCGPFADYVEDPNSVFMCLDI